MAHFRYFHATLLLGLTAAAAGARPATPPRAPVPGPLVVKLSRPGTESVLRLLENTLGGKGKLNPEDRLFVLFDNAYLQRMTPAARKKLGVEYIEPVSRLSLVPVMVSRELKGVE